MLKGVFQSLGWDARLRDFLAKGAHNNTWTLEDMLDDRSKYRQSVRRRHEAHKTKWRHEARKTTGLLAQRCRQVHGINN